MKELIQNIETDYNFVGSSYDKKGNFTGYFYLYSKTVRLSPTQVIEISSIFPKFNITHLYSNYYVIGFNKTII